jgi:hypothetical protein
MITISLKNFILTGNFGPIKIGMTKSQIIEYLGAPDEIADFGAGLSGLFYNGFEFFYDTENNDALYTIQNDNLMYYPESSGRKIKISKSAQFDTCYFTLKHTEYNRIKKALQQDNIAFTEQAGEDYDRFLFESGVELFFRHEDKHDKEEWRLTGISNSAAYNKN